MPRVHLFHIATRADWEAARQAGSYTTSTRGRTLEDEGFIHAAHREQVPTVFRRFYRDAGEPLVLLSIDTDRLTSPWAEEQVGEERWPHIRGPLNVHAVRHVSPLNRRGGSESFTSLFLKEMVGRIMLALLVMALMTIGVFVGERQLTTDWGALIGAGIGLVVGVAAVVLIVRLRRRS